MVSEEHSRWLLVKIQLLQIRTFHCAGLGVSSGGGPFFRHVVVVIASRTGQVEQVRKPQQLDRRDLRAVIHKMTLAFAKKTCYPVQVGWDDPEGHSYLVFG